LAAGEGVVSIRDSINGSIVALEMDTVSTHAPTALRSEATPKQGPKLKLSKPVQEKVTKKRNASDTKRKPM
jgi:hypothetical protein